MKKLMLSALILILTFPVLSQDTSKVMLKKTTVKKMIVDIIKGDQCAEENNLLREKIVIQENRLSEKDSIINLQQSKAAGYEQIITDKENIIQLNRLIIATVKEDLKNKNSQIEKLTSKVNRQKLTGKIMIVGAAILATIAIIK